MTTTPSDNCAGGVARVRGLRAASGELLPPGADQSSRRDRRNTLRKFTGVSRVLSLSLFIGSPIPAL